MADTTTVKVRMSTRDLILDIGAARHQSADQVIRGPLNFDPTALGEIPMEEAAE